MKKTLFTIIVVLVLSGSVFYMSQKGTPLLPQKVLDPFIGINVKNQTPEERFAMIEQHLKQSLLEAIESIQKINPIALRYGEAFTKSSINQTFTLQSETLPFALLGMENPGIESIKMHIESETDIDTSDWWYEKASGKAHITLDAQLSGFLAQQAQSPDTKLEAEIESVVDGEEVYYKLKKFENNIPMILAGPQTKNMVGKIKNQWVFMNEPMLDPLSSSRMNPSKANKRLVQKIKERLEENAKPFSVWEKPVQGKKEGEWYVYNLEIDKESLTQFVQDISPEVGNQSPETFNFDNIKTGTLQFSIHETDLERWKADGLIVNEQDQKIILKIENTQSLEKGSIRFMFVGENTQEIGWEVSDQIVVLHFGDGTRKLFDLTIKHSEEDIHAELRWNGRAVASALLKKDSKTDLWNGSVSVPSFKADGPVLSWEITEKNFEAFFWLSNYRSLKLQGAYSDTTFTAQLEDQTEEGEGKTFAKADFRKKGDTWSGTMSISDFVKMETDMKNTKEGKGEMWETKADIYLLGEKTANVHHKVSVKPIKNPQISIPQKSIPFTDIMKELGLLPMVPPLSIDVPAEYDSESILSPAPGENVPLEPVADDEIEALIEEITLPTPVAGYYEKLRKVCKKEADSESCCLASVDAMEQVGGTKIASLTENTCPKGYRGNRLKCMESFNWCEPIQESNTN